MIDKSPASPLYGARPGHLSKDASHTPPFLQVHQHEEAPRDSRYALPNPKRYSLGISDVLDTLVRLDTLRIRKCGPQTND